VLWLTFSTWAASPEAFTATRPYCHSDQGGCEPQLGLYTPFHVL
jgi:hypothetical protein